MSSKTRKIAYAICLWKYICKYLNITVKKVPGEKYHKILKAFVFTIFKNEVDFFSFLFSKSH